MIVQLLFWLAILMAGFSAPLQAQQNDPMTEKRTKMVHEQIQQRGIRNPRVLEALLRVPRHLFVLEEEKNAAYEDHPLPIGHDQTISQPYIVAYMTEVLNVKPGEKVLEIGTGSGYQAAVLAELGAEVYSVEIVPELAESAQNRLKDLGYRSVYIKHGNGFEGWSKHAPYDAIIVTAAPADIPLELVNQLKDGGRMIIPLGKLYQDLYLVTKTAEGYTRKKLLPVRFVPMVSR